MHIGIDLDNTIIRYDQVFFDCARRQGWIDAAVPPTKHAVCAAVRALPDGEIWWTRLQGLVYGQHITEAEPAPGLEAFLETCRARGLRVSVVSHKTRQPAMGPRLDLHAAALLWLERHLFRHAGRFGLTNADLHFEPTQDAKAARLLRLGCTHLVDDLLVFLEHPDLQGRLHRTLYAPEPPAVTPPDITVCRSWTEVGEHLLGARG